MRMLLKKTFITIILVIPLTFFIVFRTLPRVSALHQLKIPFIIESNASSVLYKLPAITNSTILKDYNKPVQSSHLRNDFINEQKKQTSKSTESSSSRNILSYNVHAFYYPWYASEAVNGQWSHWDHVTIPHWTAEVNRKYPQKKHIPPLDIASRFYPDLGPYSSTDENIIREHMKQLVTAGVGVLSVSWYPPETKDDNAVIFVDGIMTLILDIADEFKEKVCFHIEPYTDRSAASLRRDIVYIIDKYGSHPAFYRHKGKPLMYLYDSYHIPALEWQTLLSPGGSITIRNSPYDIHAIGLFVQNGDCQQLKSGGFDGFYTYFAAQGFVFSSTIQHWPEMKKCQVDLFIPSVGPGYDDSPVRPWNSQNTRPRKNGAYYRQMWDEAIRLGSEIVSITSFNEWHEGSQIETVRKMNGYEDYGNDPEMYLKLTKEMINKMESFVVSCSKHEY